MHFKFQKNDYYTKYKFYDTVEKKVMSLFIYSLCQKLNNKGVTCVYESNIYKIEFSDDCKTMNKSIHRGKKQFNLKSLNCDLNAYFIWHNNYLYISADMNACLDVCNRLYEKFSDSTPRNGMYGIYYVMYSFGIFLAKRPYHVITEKRFYVQ